MKNRRRKKIHDESSFMTEADVRLLMETDASKKKAECNVAEKEEIKQTYYNEWVELAKKYYNSVSHKRFVKGIDERLCPTSQMSVDGYVEEMNNLLGMLELARMGEIEKAEELYLASGASYFERLYRFSGAISDSYYFKELLNVFGKDIRRSFFDDERQYSPMLKQFKKSAEDLKREGTVEINSSRQKE